jgi:putative ATP-binding cassette transporter
MKQLFRIVLTHAGKKGIAKYLWLGIVSGFSGFFFINLITRVISVLISGTYTAFSQEYLVFFSAIVLIMIWSRRELVMFSMDITQRVSWNLRQQILALVLQAEHRQILDKKARIQAAILNDVGTLTNAALNSIDFFIQVIMCISCMVYIGVISPVLLLITIGVAGGGVGLYLLTYKKNMHYLTRARKVEEDFQNNLNDILNGFKEISMDPGIGRYLFDKKVRGNTRDSYKYYMLAYTRLTDNHMLGQMLYNSLIAATLLVFSISLGIKAGDIVSFVFTLLYLLGAITTILTILPVLMRARVASDQLIALKMELERLHSGPQPPAEGTFVRIFEQIDCLELEFSYDGGEQAFGIGPMDFRMQRGEVVFIYGGNGSGKSTFLHTLIGLWKPIAGEIRLNGALLRDSEYQEYRSMFAVVFSDFYLFKEVADMTSFDETKWNEYLNLFELQGKVTLAGNSLSTTDLSTGQRKRLALILALMKDKPILVLDEWAADQDPYFRKKFYLDIIPYLKQSGITVMAVTHDDKYYHLADKLYKMKEGQLYEERILLQE